MQDSFLLYYFIIATAYCTLKICELHNFPYVQYYFFSYT